MAYMAMTEATTAVSRGPKALCSKAIFTISRDAAMSTRASGTDASAVSRTQVRMVWRQPAQSRRAIMREK